MIPGAVQSNRYLMYIVCISSFPAFMSFDNYEGC